MRILHVVPTYLPAWRYGGPIWSVHQLCRHLACRGHDVHVFTTNVDGPDDLDVPLGSPVDVDGVSVSYFSTGQPRSLYRSPDMKLALQKSVGSFDVLHLHSVFRWPTWCAARAAARADVPYILAPRGMLVPELIQRRSRLAKTAWIRFIERRTIQHAWGVHMTSRLELEDASKLPLPWDRRFVVPNGIAAEEFDGLWDEVHPTLRSLRQTSPLMVCLGRVHPKKGIDRLIRAMATIPGAHLAVAGNDEQGTVAALGALATECGVRERVTFVGPVYGRDKAALLELMDVLVLPSHSENFGNVVLEGMAAGRPVVVTPQVGAADAVRSSGAGLVVDGDPTVLASNLRGLLGDADRRRRMGDLGRRAVLKDFAWNDIAARMEQFYSSACGALPVVV